LSVAHFQRKPGPGNFSLERLFADVRSALPAGVECVLRVCPYFSVGIFPRIGNLLHAFKSQEKINHITGDVHYLALALPGRRTLLTIPDCATLERLRGWRRAVFKLFWYTLPVRRVALVTVISESTRRELLRHVRCPPAKIRVVHCCVSREFVPALKPFASEDPEILQLGTFPNKNLERLIPALRDLRCRLHIIGKLTAAQEELLRRGQIRYTNTPEATKAEVLQAYRDCDLVVLASTYEGFGLPIVEAQAVGRPVVTSNLLSMPEVAGNAACLVDPFSVESIRDGILKVWHDAGYRQNLVAAGLENVKRFRPAAIAAQYVAIYEELAGRNV